MPVNCGNAVVQTVSVLPAHARSRPRVPAVGRCLVHVGCTARLRCTVSLGTGLSGLSDLDVPGQSPLLVARECPRSTRLDPSIGHATGTRRLARVGDDHRSVDLLLTMSIPGRNSTAATLVRTGFVVVLVLVSVPGFRPVLARAYFSVYVTARKNCWPKSVFRISPLSKLSLVISGSLANSTYSGRVSTQSYIPAWGANSV